MITDNSEMRILHIAILNVRCKLKTIEGLGFKPNSGCLVSKIPSLVLFFIRSKKFLSSIILKFLSNLKSISIVNFGLKFYKTKKLQILREAQWAIPSIFFF